jgi:hypothetical protein
MDTKFDICVFIMDTKFDIYIFIMDAILGFFRTTRELEYIFF